MLRPISWIFCYEWSFLKPFSTVCLGDSASFMNVFEFTVAISFALIYSIAAFTAFSAPWFLSSVIITKYDGIKLDLSLLSLGLTILTVGNLLWKLFFHVKNVKISVFLVILVDRYFLSPKIGQKTLLTKIESTYQHWHLPLWEPQEFHRTESPKKGENGLQDDEMLPNNSSMKAKDFRRKGYPIKFVESFSRSIGS